MGCCGDREKGIQVSEEQKWDYITLSDFKSTSCLAPFSYVWLWLLVVFSIAVYAADAFTAVNLLAFNKWSSQVKPKVSFDVAKWIFAICIIVSYAFLLYRWIRAWRVIRSGSVTESYLEPLAAIFNSMRMGKNGQGWRRFLVFAELTKSKKGVDYIALFVYFQFKGALVVIMAQGPRMAINALTLWAVMQAKLIPVGEHAAPKDRSPIIQFFLNIETLVKTGNKQETVIYFTMLFSLLVWVFAAISLLLSIIFYVFFLWHYVPSSDGSLTNYCRRKIETRLERIVGKKVKKALEKQDLKRRKEEQKAIKKGELDAPRAPTLPKLGDLDDDTASIYSVSTVTTLPPYSSNGPTRTNTQSTARTGAMHKPSLPSLAERPLPPRSDTQMTYGSDAPLLGQAGAMGMSSPLPPMPALDRDTDYFNAPSGWPLLPGSTSRPYSPMNSGRSTHDMLPPVNTSFASNGRNSPSPYQGAPFRQDSRDPSYSQQAPSRFGDSTMSPFDSRSPGVGKGPAYEMSPIEANRSDTISQQMFGSPQDYRAPQIPSSLRPASPAMSQRREVSQPLPTRGPNGYVPQQRSATAPLQQPGNGPAPGPRSNTTTPGPRNDQW